MVEEKSNSNKIYSAEDNKTYINFLKSCNIIQNQQFNVPVSQQSYHNSNKNLNSSSNIYRNSVNKDISSNNLHQININNQNGPLHNKSTNCPTLFNFLLRKHEHLYLESIKKNEKNIYGDSLQTRDRKESQRTIKNINQNLHTNDEGLCAEESLKIEYTDISNSKKKCFLMKIAPLILQQGPLIAISMQDITNTEEEKKNKQLELENSKCSLQIISQVKQYLEFLHSNISTIRNEEMRRAIIFPLNIIRSSSFLDKTHVTYDTFKLSHLLKDLSDVFPNLLNFKIKSNPIQPLEQVKETHNIKEESILLNDLQKYEIEDEKEEITKSQSKFFENGQVKTQSSQFFPEFNVQDQNEHYPFESEVSILENQIRQVMKFDNISCKMSQIQIDTQNDLKVNTQQMIHEQIPLYPIEGSKLNASLLQHRRKDYQPCQLTSLNTHLRNSETNLSNSSLPNHSHQFEEIRKSPKIIASDNCQNTFGLSKQKQYSKIIDEKRRMFQGMVLSSKEKNANQIRVIPEFNVESTHIAENPFKRYLPQQFNSTAYLTKFLPQKKALSNSGLLTPCTNLETDGLSNIKTNSPTFNINIRNNYRLFYQVLLGMITTFSGQRLDIIIDVQNKKLYDSISFSITPETIISPQHSPLNPMHFDQQKSSFSMKNSEKQSLKSQINQKNNFNLGNSQPQQQGPSQIQLQVQSSQVQSFRTNPNNSPYNSPYNKTQIKSSLAVLKSNQSLIERTNIKKQQYTNINTLSPQQEVFETHLQAQTPLIQTLLSKEDEFMHNVYYLEYPLNQQLCSIIWKSIKNVITCIGPERIKVQSNSLTAEFFVDLNVIMHKRRTKSIEADPISTIRNQPSNNFNNIQSPQNMSQLPFIFSAQNISPVQKNCFSNALQEQSLLYRKTFKNKNHSVSHHPSISSFNNIKAANSIDNPGNSISSSTKQNKVFNQRNSAVQNSQNELDDFSSKAQIDEEEDVSNLHNKICDSIYCCPQKI